MINVGLQKFKMTEDSEDVSLLMEFSTGSHSDADTAERFQLRQETDSPGLSSR